MYIWYLGTPFLFWVMGGRASIWDCQLYASIGGDHGGLGRCERERERERESLMTFCLFLEREFYNLMT